LKDSVARIRELILPIDFALQDGGPPHFGNPGLLHENWLNQRFPATRL